MIKGKHVGIRPLQSDDAWILFKWFNDPKVIDDLGVREPRPSISLEEEMEIVQDKIGKRSVRPFLLHDLDLDVPAGLGELTHIDVKNASAKVFLVIGEPELFTRCFLPGVARARHGRRVRHHEPAPSGGPGPGLQRPFAQTSTSLPDSSWKAGSGTTISGMAPTSTPSYCRSCGTGARADARREAGPSAGRRSGEPAQFLGWVNDPEVTQFLMVDPPLGMEQEEAWFEGLRDREAMIFTVQTKEGEVIGNCGLEKISWKDTQGDAWHHHRFEDALGQGLRHRCGPDAASSFFDELNLMRVCLICDQGNARAQRAYEKCGFRTEGIMRAFRYKNGAYVDEVLMSILRPEWLEMQTELDDQLLASLMPGAPFSNRNSTMRL